VNHAVLAVVNPEQVEVEIWRSDELEVRRGLRSELDEMCRGAALGRAAMSSRDDHEKDGDHVLTRPTLRGWSPGAGMRTSLSGTQARYAEESPLQEVHVAEVHYGKAVRAEPENPDNSSFTRR